MRRLTILVVISSTLLVPSATHAFPLSAGVHQPVEERRAEPSDRSLWRGPPPLICAVRECPEAEPTFCLVEASERVLEGARGADPCERGLGLRDAGGFARQTPQVRR